MLSEPVHVNDALLTVIVPAGPLMMLVSGGVVSGQAAVVPLGELEIGEVFGTSSEVFRAK